MINLLKLSTYNKPNIWTIIGDKWAIVKNNIFSKKQIDSFWAGNELLTSGRINYISNFYDRLTQLSNYGILDFLIIENVKNKLIINNEVGTEFPYYLDIFFNDIYQYSGINVNYLYPPKILTNNLLPAEYNKKLLSLFINNIDTKNKIINVAEDNLLTRILCNFKNYIFIDDNYIPFKINHFSDNKIYYSSLILDKIPKIGSLDIYDKFELVLDIDYKVENFKDKVRIRFKNINFITSIYEINKNINKVDINLYSTNCYVLDNFNLEHFGKPIGLDYDNYSILLDNNDIKTTDQKIIKLWKLNQRQYDLKQAFRLSNIISDQSHATTINGKELLYKIEKENKKVYTSKLKAIITGTIVNFENIPEDLQAIFKYVDTDNKKYNILKIEDLYNNIGININDKLFIENNYYEIKKIYDSKYIELKTELLGGDFTKIIKVLDGSEQKVYNLNDYGIKEQFIFDSVPGETTNLSDINPFSKIKWGEKLWGTFIWGQQSYKKVHEKTRFNSLVVGNEYLYGDPFVQTILLDFYEGNLITDFVQRDLAIKNKLFTQSNAEAYLKNKNLVISPFLNYSFKKESVFLEELATEAGEVIQTESGQNITLSDYSGWGVVGDITTTQITKTIYNFSYTNYIFTNKFDKLLLDIDSLLNNKTAISLLSFFLKVNSGMVRIGVSELNNFYDTNACKFMYYDTKKWINGKIYFNINNINARKIIIESLSDNTEIEIFGTEFFNSVPNFSEKLNKNKELFNRFISSNDYNLINLL